MDFHTMSAQGLGSPDITAEHLLRELLKEDTGEDSDGWFGLVWFGLVWILMVGSTSSVRSANCVTVILQVSKPFSSLSLCATIFLRFALTLDKNISCV